MFHAEFEVKTLLFTTVQRNVTASLHKMQVVFEKNIQPLRTTMLQEFETVPPPASQFYPLKWRNEKQRRFVIMKLRHEGNLPYQRGSSPSDVIKSWLVEHILDGNGGFFHAQNTSPHAIRVFGLDREPMFMQQIPWVDFYGVLPDYQKRAIPVAINSWFEASDPFAGLNE